MKTTYIKLLSVSVVLLLALSTLYFHSRASDWGTNGEDIENLREIRLLNALINQDLLKVRFELFSDYDELSNHMSRLRNTIDAVANSSKGISNEKQIEPYKAILRLQFHEKSALVERFKSTNALLKNSLVRFPTLVREMQAKLPVRSRLSTYSDKLVRDILLYSLINDDQLDTQMSNRIDALKSWKTSARGGINKYLDNIYQHAQYIVNKRHDVNNMIVKISEMPIDDISRDLQQAYLTQFQSNLYSSNQYRVVLFILSLLLLGYTAYVLLKFKHKGDELASEKNRALVTLHSIGDGVITTNSIGHVQLLNPVAEQLTGWTNKEANGQPLNRLFQVTDESTGAPVINLVDRCIRENSKIVSTSQSILMNRDGKSIPIEDSVAPIRGDNNEALGAIIVFRDVSRTRELSRKLSFQATHDPLTGVINRRAFEHKLAKTLRNAKKFDEQHALLYVDLDQFKVVNDTCGHDAGDQLLVQITALLKNQLGDMDTVARLGGDEFGILLEKCNPDCAHSIAEKLLQSVKKFRFEWHGINFQLGASIGLVAIHENSDNIVSTLSAADMACYVAKDTGRNRVHVFNNMDKEYVKRHDEMQWVSKLTQAFKEHRFILHRQPVIPISRNSKDMNHYELLLRLRDNDGELIPPNEFIPAAERYNFMPILDRWVIRTAFAASQNLEDGTRYAINISGTSLNSNSLLEYIKQEAQKIRLNPSNICFEITETAAIENLEKAANLVENLKKLGFMFALDDFGKGLSSFTYLKALPVDYLKIDGEFVRDLDNNPVYYEIINSVNHIGHLMGMQTIAECVEDDITLEKLLSIGVDYVQGHKFGKPEPLPIGRKTGKQSTVETNVKSTAKEKPKLHSVPI